MIILSLLLACDVSLDDTAAPAPVGEPLAACLAAGGSLSELSSSPAWSGGLSDLEQSSDGTIYALTRDGHVLSADPADLSGLRDLGVTGAYGMLLDVAGDTLLADAGGVHIGALGTDASTWTAVPSAWGDSAVAPDGSAVAYVYAGCGIEYGVIDLDAGTTGKLDTDGGRVLPLGFEYLDDGRLIANALVDYGDGGVAVYDGATLEADYAATGNALWTGDMEALGQEVVLATMGDGTHGTLERFHVDDGHQSAVDLPFSFSLKVGIDPSLSYALDYEGLVVASDGASLTELGTFPGTVDLEAAADGTWLALAGSDGAIHLYTCTDSPL